MHKDSTTQAKQKKDEREEVLKEIRQLENRQKILENKQPDLFQDFFAFVFFLFRLGGAVFVHIAFSFGGFIQPRLI